MTATGTKNAKKAQRQFIARGTHQAPRWCSVPSQAKTTDIDALSLRLEASTAAVRREIETAAATLRAEHANSLSLQAVTLARIEEGMKGLNARLDDWRAQPQVMNAGSPARPAPPPHARQKAQKKASDGFLSFAAH